MADDHSATARMPLPLRVSDIRAWLPPCRPDHHGCKGAFERNHHLMVAKGDDMVSGTVSGKQREQPTGDGELATIIAVFLNQSTAIDINPLLTRYREAYGKHWPERLAKDFRQSGVLRQEHRQLARQLLAHLDQD